MAPTSEGTVCDDPLLELQRECTESCRGMRVHLVGLQELGLGASSVRWKQVVVPLMCSVFVISVNYSNGHTRKATQ